MSCLNIKITLKKNLNPKNSSLIFRPPLAWSETIVVDYM
jgi:hypothetical protein